MIKLRRIDSFQFLPVCLFLYISLILAIFAYSENIEDEVL